MYKDQRKEIIKQIEDLSKHRKSVAIDQINTHGMSFADESPVIEMPEGHDSNLYWSIVSYETDIAGSPTDTLFVDLINTNLPVVTNSEVVSLNGLTHSGIFYRRLIRYRTKVKFDANVVEHLTIKGKCKATVFVGDRLVLSHTYIEGDDFSEESSTITPVAFSKDCEYTISVFVYGHLPQVNGSAVHLTSQAFKFIEISTMPTIARPLNAFATNNLSNSVRISWEQDPSAYLQGGGVEIWVKQNEVDEDYIYLDRVPFPTNFYLHTDLPGNRALNNNSTFDFYNADTSVITPSEPSDSEGLIDWGLLSSGDTTVVLANSDLDGYTNKVSISLDTIRESLFSNIISASLPYNQDGHLINSGTPVNFVYSATSELSVQCFEAKSAATDATVIWSWSAKDVGSATVVQCSVNSTALGLRTYSVNASDGYFAYTLSAQELLDFKNDPTSITATFKTEPTDLGDGDTTATINLSSVVMLYQQGTGSVYASLSSNYFPIEYDDVVSIDSLYKVYNAIDTISCSLQIYDKNYTLLNAFSTTIFDLDEISGTWLRSKADFTVNDRQAMFGKIAFTVSHTTLNNNLNTVVDIQYIKATRVAGKQLPSGVSFSYKLRNYTSTLNYSIFTQAVIGRTADALNTLTISTDSNNYISPFSKKQIKVQSSAALADLDVYAYSPDTGDNIMLSRVVSDVTNWYDFTYYLTSLFSVPVVVDYFDTDYTLGTVYAPNQVIPTSGRSSENSPAKIFAMWAGQPGNEAYIVDSGSADFPIGPWNTEYYQAHPEFFRVFRNLNSSAGAYKLYDLHSVASFYKGLEGNTDNVHHLADTNSKKFSIGFIIKPDVKNLTDNAVVFLSLNLCSVVFKKTTSTKGAVEVYLRTPTLGSYGMYSSSVLFAHDLIFDEFYTTDSPHWLYIHCSADAEALDDPNRTFLAAYVINGSSDCSLSNSTENVTINEADITRWNWENIVSGSLGSVSNPELTPDINMFYLAANVMPKDILEQNIVPLAAIQRTPLFFMYGLDTSGVLSIQAEGIQRSSSKASFIQSGTPISSMVSGTIDVTVNMGVPDGSMYILREAYTLRQEDIDNMSEVQPLLTYVRNNKLFVDLTSPLSPIAKIRFSNDNLTWGEWLNFNNQILYPWLLEPLAEGEEYADRTVFCQAVTVDGMSTDPLLATTLRDTIQYNPVGSLGGLESYNYVFGQSGWKLGLNGDAEFNNIFIRGNSLVAGSILSSSVINQPWVFGQLDEMADNEWRSSNKRRVNSQPSYGPWAFRYDVSFVENTWDSNKYKKIRMVGYPTDFVVDLFDKNIAYIPMPLDSTLVVCVERVDMRLDDSAYPFNSGVYRNRRIYLGRSITADPTMLSKAIPHVALDGTFLYIGDFTTVYKCDKSTLSVLEQIYFPQTTVTFDAYTSASVGGCIGGLSIAKTETDDRYLYVYFPYADPSNPCVTIAAIDLNDFTTKYIYTKSVDSIFNSLNIDSTHHIFATNVIACDGKWIAICDQLRNPGFVIHKLNKDGSTEDLSIVQDNTTFLYLDTASEYRSKYIVLNGLLTPWNSFVGPSSVVINDNKLVLYTSPYVFKNSIVSENKDDFINYKMICSYDLNNNEQYVQTIDDTFKSTTLDCAISLFPGRIARDSVWEYPVYQMYGATGSIINNTTAGDAIYYSSMGYPYMYWEDDVDDCPYAIGFGTPAFIGDSIVIPYNNMTIIESGSSTNDHKCPSSLLLKFNSVGGNITFDSILLQRRNSAILSVRYDGKFLWMLTAETNQQGDTFIERIPI